nr:cell division protein FtsQ/DivIB [Sphingomicrobium nitratireducens]
MGFRVQSVDVVGIERMDSKPVYALALDQRASALPLVDVEGIRGRLLDYGWVKDARVSRRYPDTLVVDILEREPAALWQGKDRLFLIDEEGVLLDRVPVSDMPDLPLLFGDGANQAYPELVRLLDGEPALRAQLASARRVGGRRWDLNVQSGEIILLPEGEDDARAALAKFMKMDRATPLLGLGIERYDLRVPGQAIARVPGLSGEQD